MTDATIHDFVQELKKLNPEQSDNIRIWNFETLIFYGDDVEKLNAPYPFAWDEEHGGFSDLAALNTLQVQPLYQVFFVKKIK